MATPFTNVLNKVDAVMASFAASSFGSLAGYFSGAVHTAFVLYVIVMGISWLNSNHGWTLSYVATHLCRGAFIYLFALNWGTFNTYVYGALANLPQEVGTHLQSAFGVGGSGGAGGLDALSVKFWSGAKILFAEGGLRNPGPWIAAILIILAGIFMCVCAFFQLFGAKVLFGLTIGLAPLFIPTLFFAATRNIFESWTRAVLGFQMIAILVNALLALGIYLIGDYASIVSTGKQSMDDTAVFCIMLIAVGLLITRAEGVGAGLVGSVSGGSPGMAMASMAASPLRMAGSFAGNRMKKRMGDRDYNARREQYDRAKERQRKRMQDQQRAQHRD